MITVYIEDSDFEEKARTPEGFHVSYQGFHTHIHWSEEENVYYGQLEGIKDRVVFKKPADGLNGQMLEFSVGNAFIRSVKDYIAEHPHADINAQE